MKIFAVHFYVTEKEGKRATVLERHRERMSERQRGLREGCSISTKINILVHNENVKR
jgi:hypothetical protein